MRIKQILLVLAMSVFSYNITVIVPNDVQFKINTATCWSEGLPWTFSYDTSVHNIKLTLEYPDSTHKGWSINKRDTVYGPAFEKNITSVGNITDTVVPIYDTTHVNVRNEVRVPAKVYDYSPNVYYDITGRRITSINKHGRYFARKIKLIQLK